MTMKTQITFAGQRAQMTHKQIAELVNSRPDNVKVSIERLAERGVIRLPAMQEIEEINNLGLTVKREYYCFEGEQGKRDSIVVVAQLSPEFTAQLVDEWQALEKAVKFLQIPELKPAHPEPAANHDILSLARVVAEATASATMKAVMEVAGSSLITTAPALPAGKPQMSDAKEEPEYVPIHKVSWSTGLSDATCRRLIDYAELPNQKTPGIRGLLVHKESFMSALCILLEGSAPPAKGRKRWQHPEFGGFVLRKDPKEIFVEAGA